jgi:hypothetical protein
MRGTVRIVNKDEGLAALEVSSGEYTIIEVPHVGLEIGDLVSGDFDSVGSTILKNDTKDELLHVFIQAVNVTLEQSVNALRQRIKEVKKSFQAPIEIMKPAEYLESVKPDKPAQSAEPSVSSEPVSIELENKRNYVIELLMGCPFGKPLDDCSSRDMRKLPIKEQMNELNRMTEEAVTEIITHHKNCLKKREGK